MQNKNDAFRIKTKRGVISLSPERARNPEQRVLKGRAHAREVGLSCQMFIGLNVGSEERWTPGHIQDFVATQRSEQLRIMVDQGRISPTTEHGFSVVPQLGFWAAVGKDGHEKSVSVYIISDLAENEIKDGDSALFELHMDEIAEKAAVDLSQWAIIYQIIDHGVVIKSKIVETELRNV